MNGASHTCLSSTTKRTCSKPAPPVSSLYRVLTPPAATEARRDDEHDDVELILSDQRMPGMSATAS